MVQEARLDLTRAAARLGLIIGPALGLAAGMGGVAQAQPLMPNPGLTSLLQPQRLDRSRPLMSPDRSAGTQSGLQQNRLSQATPCDSGAAAAPGGYSTAPTGPSLVGSGSGPGPYGRYMPGAPPETASAKTPAATASQPGTSRAATADRPFYGGVDRPLWDTGERRAAATTGSLPSKTTPAGQTAKDATGKDAASTAPLQPNALPAPVRDRPLWAEGSLSGLPNPVTAAPGASGADPANGAAADATASAAVSGGFAPSPCTASALPR